MTDEVDSLYSWVVVSVCFVVYFVNFGILKISGLLYPAIILFYNVDRERASAPFLIGSVARSISGPLCGYLSHVFGFRIAISLGCFLSSVGIFACSLAKDINALCIIWCVYGLGCGLSTHILPQVINLFNHNHATNANGIALCGASVAGIILPFIVVVLLNEYGMSGTFLIISAIMLNAMPCVLLLRTPKDSNSKNSNRKYIVDEEKSRSEGDRVSSLEISSNYKPCSLNDSKHNQIQHKTGYFRDHLGSYNGLVYIFSGISILCSVLVLLIPSISSWRLKRKENTSNLTR